MELSKTSIGQVNGEADLAGRGNSVRRMLASSSGKVGLVIAGGEISKLMMEKIGLHLWEILELKVTGDRLVKLRCGVADFDVKEGTMHANALIFDTEVTTIIGTGSIDLEQEKLDLTLNQKTKNTSPVALRSPIYICGSFAKPDIGVDKGRVAARARRDCAGHSQSAAYADTVDRRRPGEGQRLRATGAGCKGFAAFGEPKIRPSAMGMHRGPRSANRLRRKSG